MQLKENDISNECACLIAPTECHQQLIAAGVNTPKTVQTGQYLVQWKRYFDCFVFFAPNLEKWCLRCVI